MKTEQFLWRVFDFKQIKINTYFEVKTNTMLFAERDIVCLIFKNIFSVEEMMNYEQLISKNIQKKKIKIYIDKKWEIVDVLDKRDIIQISSIVDTEEMKEILFWMEEIIKNSTENCFLDKDSKEYEFLNLASNRFLDLYAEINGMNFMDNMPEIRLYKIKEIFSIYSELLLYEPDQEHIAFLENTRPPMYAVISSEFVKFLRNILAHFPFFTSWNDIYVSKSLVNWANEGKTIDKFLNKYQGHESVVYRIKNSISKEWIYPTISFPKLYNNEKIYIKDMIDEKEGILLCVAMMYNVVMSQIIEINDKK